MKYNNYTIERMTSNIFRMFTENEKTVIIFEAEYKNGLYFNIKKVVTNNRTYNARRYFYKYIYDVKEAAYKLALNGNIWDYQNNCNALKYYNNVEA